MPGGAHHSPRAPGAPPPAPILKAEGNGGVSMPGQDNSPIGLEGQESNNLTCPWVGKFKGVSWNSNAFFFSERAKLFVGRNGRWKTSFSSEGTTSSFRRRIAVMLDAWDAARTTRGRYRRCASNFDGDDGQQVPSGGVAMVLTTSFLQQFDNYWMEEKIKRQADVRQP